MSPPRVMEFPPSRLGPGANAVTERRPTKTVSMAMAVSDGKRVAAAIGLSIAVASIYEQAKQRRRVLSNGNMQKT